MIISKIIGGIGNQLFQYAIARSLAEKYNCNFKIDNTSFFSTYKLHKYNLNNFNIIENLTSKKNIEIFKQAKKKNILNKLNIILGNKKNKYKKEKGLSFNKRNMKITPPLYLEGYWQDERYFRGIRDILIKEITLKKPLENTSNLENIKNTNSVSIHIRRGDYVNNPKTLKKHGICSLEYYREAIELIKEKINDPHFFIFSNDVEWVKENLKIEKMFTLSGANYTDCEELILMSKCKHNIIANSTFSWWAAWLNQAKDKIIIAPKQWFNNVDRNKQTKNLIPKSWIKI